jgi:hypothetical protein
MDDFIRNFYVKMGLTRTAEVFEAEWYELKATGRLQGAATTVPDIYLRNGVSGTAPVTHGRWPASCDAGQALQPSSSLHYEQLIGHMEVAY